MYEDFTVNDRWTAEPLHCTWKGTVVAIATRHADATDIRFAVNGRPRLDRPAESSLGRTEAPHRSRSSPTTLPLRSPVVISRQPSSPATTTVARCTP